MCNANNHPVGCTCGWGGDGHLGRRDDGSYSPAPVLASWKYRHDKLCQQVECPICGQEVSFIRHKGGALWFERLGAKHSCFPDDGYNAVLQNSLFVQNEFIKKLFGLIQEIEITRAGVGARINIFCLSGDKYDCEFNVNFYIIDLVGSIVIVADNEVSPISIEIISKNSSDSVILLKAFSVDSYLVQCRKEMLEPLNLARVK